MDGWSLDLGRAGSGKKGRASSRAWVGKAWGWWAVGSVTSIHIWDMLEPFLKSSRDDQQRLGFNIRKSWWWAQAHFIKWLAYSRGQFLFFTSTLLKMALHLWQWHNSIDLSWMDGLMASPFPESLLKHLLNSSLLGSSILMHVRLPCTMQTLWLEET